MTHDEIETYLADALDQEACKPTLVSALTSRVIALQNRGIPMIKIMIGLENICDDPDQINNDVIDNVLEWMLTTPIDAHPFDK